MDVLIKVLISGWVLFSFGVFLKGWVKTWFELGTHTPTEYPFIHPIVMVAVSIPHNYLILNAFRYLGISEYFYLFVIIYIINSIKSLVNERRVYDFSVDIRWDIVLYIPGIIYIFNH
jgi:hypothetical protein